MIPCTIRTKFQSCCLDLLPKPSARGEMRLTEGRPVHTTLGGGTDLSELVEGSPHPVGVDAQLRWAIHHDIPMSQADFT